ncbi:MAG TPA: hypothetical protein VKM55_26615 [Candidatus Lokiarchaeia archaeon]|nr:hypothetical protein [Candidatus Lokiarchaeia archaeon]
MSMRSPLPENSNRPRSPYIACLPRILNTWCVAPISFACVASRKYLTMAMTPSQKNTRTVTGACCSRTIRSRSKSGTSALIAGSRSFHVVFMVAVIAAYNLNPDTLVNF